MKTQIISASKVLITITFLFAASSLFFSSCSEKSTDPPVLTTENVTAITQTSAASGGSISSDGGASIESRGLCWSTSANPTIDDNVIIEGTGTGSFTGTLTNLLPNTQYYVRAFATNSAGTGYGNQVTFTTEQAQQIELTTTDASSITAGTAVSGGDVTSDGGDAVTEKGVCWSTSQNPTTADSKTSDGTGTGIFTSNLTSLSSNTTYYLRAYATNSTGTVYGNEVTFTTPPGPNEVLISNYAFNPATLTIAANTTVTWTNKDGVGHTVTSDTGVFESGTLNTNGTFSYTFTTPGSYPYHCTPHPYMTATVIVN